MPAHAPPPGDFTLSLNYDDKEALSREQSLDTFAASFKEFPRSRLFTPAWWQNLLSYDTAYLLSAAEKAAMLQIHIDGNVLSVNNVPLEFPLSPSALVRLLGEERLTKGYSTAKDYDGNPVEYNRTSFLLWNDAGIMAARDDEDYNWIPALYLQLLERTETDTSVPLPEHPFSGTFSLDGLPVQYEEGNTIRSGCFEITFSASAKGYVEIACPSVRCHQFPSHHYRTLLQENRRLALDDKEHIRALEKAEARGKEYRPGISNKKLLLQLSKDYLMHAFTALSAGYAGGKSEKYLRSILLDPLAEAVLKRYEYRKIAVTDLLPVVSAFILLNLDPRDFGKFTDRLKASGVHDFVTDTLIRYKLPGWEIADTTVFPEWKARLTATPSPGETTVPGAEESPGGCDALIISHAILKIRNKP